MKRVSLLFIALTMAVFGTVAQTVTSSPLPIILIETDLDAYGNHIDIPDEPKAVRR